MPVSPSSRSAVATDVADDVADTLASRFFVSVYQKFQQAERSMEGSVDRFYRIGGYTVRLRFAGPALVPVITPALQHLAIMPCSEPAITICLWDTVSTDTRMQGLPWSTDDYLTRGDVRGYNDDAFRTAYHNGSGTLHLLSNKQDLAVFWLNDARLLPYYESGAPLQTILHWWLADHGCQFIHAGAVGTPDGGVVLAGKGNSGKSTSALACLNSDLVYASDDYCLLAAAPAPFVHSMYSSAKLNPPDLDRFPHLAPSIKNPDQLETEKALLFLNPLWSKKITTGFPLRAILVSQVTGNEITTLSPASRGAALRALAPSTIFQLSGAGRQAFQTISECVRKVPCYYLKLGSDMATIPQVILELLNERHA